MVEKSWCRSGQINAWEELHVLENTEKWETSQIWGRIMDTVIVYGSWKLTLCGLKSFSAISEAEGDFEAGVEQGDSR